MKKILLWISILAISALCACNTTEKNVPSPTPTLEPVVTVTPTVTPTPTSTPKATPTPSLDVLAQRYINGLERMDITRLNCYVDKEDSIRNSNLMNYGYLTYDEEGNLYYVDQNTNAIYVSDYNGENKRLIYENEDVFGWLQVKDDWLYFNTSRTAIKRVNITTGEVEDLLEELSGDFIIDGDKIYTNLNGLCASDINGQNTEVIDASLQYTYLPSYSDDYGVSNVSGIMSKGYVLVFDGETTKVLKQRGLYPLLAGNYLCMSDAGGSRNLTTKFRVWNIKTGKEFELGLYADQTVVSDGETIYFCREGYNHQIGRTWNGEELSLSQTYNFFYRWNEKMKEPELFWIPTAAKHGIYNIFLTPKAIYAEDNVYKDGKNTYTLFYYDLETGETGVVY